MSPRPRLGHARDQERKTRRPLMCASSKGTLTNPCARPATLEDVITRVAAPDEASTIAEIHVRSRQQAYRGSLPQPFLDSLDPVQRVDRWRESIENQGPPAQPAIVIADRGRLLGFAHICPSRDDDQRSMPVGELTSPTYGLMPDAWGKGLGQQLMTHALELLRQAGNAAAMLRILDRNARAIHFYEASGWTPDGAVKHAAIADTTVVEIRYRTAL